MKIGVITFHFVNNFGGILQCYALQRVLKEKFKSESLVIDYRNWFIRLTDFIRLFPITKNKEEFLTGLRTFSYRRNRKEKFIEFNKTHLNMSKTFYSSMSISEKELNCDFYICGSDQIWNPFLTCGFAPAYFLSFVNNSEKKISYAPSLGTGRWRSYMFLPVRKYIKLINGLSIREYEGKRLIKKLTGRDVRQLIDPTFLLTYEQWSEIAIDPEIDGKYILLYIMQKDDEVYSYVREIKRRLNLPVVEISRYGYKPECVDKTLIDLGPSEYLGLFKNAEFICTNSYHGLVFSIIFEKEFCLVPSKKFRGRIYNLLKLLDIYIQPVLDEEEELKAIFDKHHVKEVVANEVDNSVEYLEACLNRQAFIT